MDYRTDMELVQRFRFTRHSMEDLVDQVAPMIERPTGRSSAIPVSAFADNICSAAIFFYRKLIVRLVVSISPTLK
jgi:hypothetical protein